MSAVQELYRVHLDETISAGQITPMMVFPIGSFHSAKYPDLEMTEELAHEIIANFEAGVLGREPVVDSSGRHDVSAPAAGWVKKVYLASYEEGAVTGMALWADVKWTSLGAKLLSDEEYKYGSVEIGPVVMNESGETIANVLRSLTLCNTPVLSIMPAVKDAKAAQRQAAVIATLSEFSLREFDPNVGGGVDRDRIPAADFAGPNRSFPIVTPDDVEDAARSLGRAADSAAVKAKIIAIAKRKGAAFVAKLPDAWTASEVVLAGTPENAPGSDGADTDDPINGLLADFADWHGKLKAALKGQAGNSAVHASIKACRDQLAQFCDGLKTSEDTDPVDDGRRSEADSQRPATAVKATEDTRVREQSQEGGEPTMKSIITKLNLAEDSDESIVLAEVTKLIERVEAAEAKLAETEKAARKQDAEVKLGEAIKAANVLPAEKDALLALAESAPDVFAATLEARKNVKLVDTAEHGQGSRDGKTELNETEIGKDPAKAYAEAIATYMAEHKLSGVSGHDKARAAIKREQPEVYADYTAFLSEGHVGQLSPTAPSGDV